MARVTTVVRLNPGLRKELETAAGKRNRSLSRLIETICLTWIQRHQTETGEKEIADECECPSC